MPRLTDHVVLDRAFIMRGRSGAGGWNRKQLAAIGITWPPRKGWISRATGRRVSRVAADKFLALRRDSGEPTDTACPICRGADAPCPLCNEQKIPVESSFSRETIVPRANDPPPWE